MITAVNLHATPGPMAHQSARAFRADRRSVGDGGRPTRHAQRGGAVQRLLLSVLTLALLAGLGAWGALWWWAHQPMALSQPAVEWSIEQGTTPRGVAQGWVDAGVQTSPRLLYEWFRWSGQARKIRAGSYEVSTGVTPAKLLSMMVRGDESLAVVRLIDGWTFRRWREELARAEGLQQQTAQWDEAAIMQALGSPGLPAEGQFFPDTYAYAKGSSDLAVMRRAHRAMQRHLADAWAHRSPGSPLKSPQEALILASIVEKETGHEAERPMIAGVFSNRLRIGMPLQTDPTVIYGLGAAFDGNLRRIHLTTDTPFNTYTRAGLPPTPIAMPGKRALHAAVRPQRTRALYFVARGDGTSEFSESLTNHNRAVNRFQRNRP